MIKELISTSTQRSLNGNAGFGIVAQTSGMSSNVSTVVDLLSGYTHVAAPGSGKNPVAYLHALRRVGGGAQHIVSRIADSGNDHTGRSNRIAHHFVIEEGEIRNLPNGPADLAMQSIFRTSWNEKPTELPPKELRFPDVSAKKCTIWERMTGDAGWGGIVAERVEKGIPVNIIFSPEHNSNDLLALIGEALALLPSSVRWRVTFSTYFMRSQETSSESIQIRCVLANSTDDLITQKSPNALRLDLRQQQIPVPPGKYVELARGTVNPASIMQSKTLVHGAMGEPEIKDQVFDLQPQMVSVPGVPASGNSPLTKKRRIGSNYSDSGKYSYSESNVTDKRWWIYLVLLVAIVIVVSGIFAYKAFTSDTWKQLNETKTTLQDTKKELAELTKEMQAARELLRQPKEGEQQILANLIREMIDEKDKAIDEQKKIVVAKDGTIEDLKRDLEKERKIVTEREDDIKKLNKECEEQQKKITELTEQNKKLPNTSKTFTVPQTIIENLVRLGSSPTPPTQPPSTPNQNQQSPPIPLQWPQGFPSPLPPQQRPVNPAQQRSDALKQQGRERSALRQENRGAP